jgi:23S rRNA (cytosine1962-C5)-methyltransferase
VFAESDGLPGFIVDAYAQILVVQCLTAGADYWRKTFVDLLVDLAGPGAVVERSDVEVRALEGLQPRVGVLYGSKPVERLVIHEHSLDFYVNVLTGQKTGFYIDQRRNRDRLRKATYGRRVLNCFSYTGAFSVYALAGGADHVLSIDSSADALAWGEENLTLNGFLPERASWKHADVFQELRLLRDKAEVFDVIVLDPPKFAPTKAQAERAARGYKDINLLAMKLLKPGGLLYTFSCSGGISADLFQKIVAGAAFDAGVNGRIIERLSQSPDHPVSVFFPEGEYLKGLVVEVNS